MALSQGTCARYGASAVRQAMLQCRVGARERKALEVGIKVVDKRDGMEYGDT